MAKPRRRPKNVRGERARRRGRQVAQGLNEHARDPDHDPGDQRGQARKYQKVIQDSYHPPIPPAPYWDDFIISMACGRFGP
jgi:hypothetical protein